MTLSESVRKEISLQKILLTQVFWKIGFSASSLNPFETNVAFMQHSKFFKFMYDISLFAVIL